MVRSLQMFWICEILLIKFWGKIGCNRSKRRLMWKAGGRGPVTRTVVSAFSRGRQAPPWPGALSATPGGSALTAVARSRGHLPEVGYSF